VLLLAAVLAVYLADLVGHLSYMAAMRDLVVYRDGGLIVRHVSPAYDAHRASPLYDWVGQHGVQFTYPPFAAVLFSVASVLSWTAMRWAMTLASLAALGLSLWLVFGALGYRDRPAIRLGATLGVSALALATEPVQQTLSLGQVNLLLMLLVAADLLTVGALVPGGRTRWWHGTGIGIAVIDSGIDSGHRAFLGGDHQSRIVFSHDFTGENRTDDPFGHGTHVAGSVLGDGTASGGTVRGTAPKAKLFFQSLLDSDDGLGGLPLVLHDLFVEA